MREVTVQEAKTQLSRLLRRVEAGEEIVIRRGKTPIARLAPLRSLTQRRTRWGSLPGKIGPEFDDPIDDFEAYI